jgi:hypothetical protein
MVMTIASELVGVVVLRMLKRGRGPGHAEEDFVPERPGLPCDTYFVLGTPYLIKER